MRALHICRSGPLGTRRSRWRFCARRLACRIGIAFAWGAVAGALGGGAPAPAAASSAWLPNAREILARAKWIQSNSDEAFCPAIGVDDELDPCGDGGRAAYAFDGRSRLRSGIVEAEAGLSRGVALDASLSYSQVRFDDTLTRRRTRGLGDLRIGARFALARGAAPVAPFVALKIPLGDAPSAPQAIQLSEMQLDLEAGVFAGASLWPRPAFLAASCGYRVRGENRDTRRDPGNEIFASFDAGIRAGRLLAKGGVSGLWGGETIDRGTNATKIVEAGKRATQISAGALFDLSARAAIDAAITVPVRGRNYPTGVTFVAGLSVRLGV
ncbi:MAG: transporter [bacterium]